MKPSDFRQELWLPAPLDKVFPFFADARNLETIAPGGLRFSIATAGPIEMRRGARIEYRLRVHGWPMRWESEITAWEPPRRFVDEQRRGPYRLWIHEHRFEESDGGTRCLDHVRYAVPGGVLVDRWWVRRDIQKIFEFRRQKLLSIFPARSETARN